MLKDKANIISEVCDYQKEIAKTGFDWPDAEAVIDKVREELGELSDEIVKKQGSQQAIEEEYGDLLLVIMHLGNHLSLNPVESLHKAHMKLITRFKKLLSLVDINTLNTAKDWQIAWNKAKELDKNR